jgi:hypothetical protein
MTGGYEVPHSTAFSFRGGVQSDWSDVQQLWPARKLCDLTDLYMKVPAARTKHETYLQPKLVIAWLDLEHFDLFGPEVASVSTVDEHLEVRQPADVRPHGRTWPVNP